MGLERKPIVIIRRCCLGRCLRFFLRRGIILPVRTEIDVVDVQLYGDPLHAALVVIGPDAEVSHSGHKVALVEVLRTQLSLSAPCGSPVEIGNVISIRVLRTGIGCDREVGALGVADLRKDGIGRQTAYDSLLVDAHASLSSLNAS